MTSNDLFAGEDIVEEEEEEELFEETDYKIQNPTIGLSPENYPIGYVMSGGTGICSCGAKIDEYYKVFQYNRKVIENKKQKIDENGKKMFHLVKEWKHFGYPEIYCHCQCGKKWGEHYIKETEEQKISCLKNDCVQCGRPIRNSIRAYDEKGNYCIRCNGEASRKRCISRTDLLEMFNNKINL